MKSDGLRRLARRAELMTDALRRRLLPPWDARATWLVIVLAAMGLVAFVVAVAPWLLTRYPHHGLTAADALRAKNDVRTTLVQALAGVAVAGGLVTTYRTYRLSKSQQVTETYTKAIEQLGHTDAPVRLGALYSLERPGQDNPDRRQTVVDVLCAYLRMPYTPAPPADPDRTPADAAAPDPDRGTGHDPRQELQVRQTAQRLLGVHVRCPANTKPTEAAQMRPSATVAFWPGMSLDLTSAVLVGFDLTGAVAEVDFRTARFTGNARFIGATFTGEAWFGGATFMNGAWFDAAIFTGNARFGGATFIAVATFEKATFTGSARSVGGIFGGDARFVGATFAREAWFGEATFEGDAQFGDATFTGSARYVGARFTANARFGRASSKTTHGSKRRSSTATPRSARRPFNDRHRSAKRAS